MKIDEGVCAANSLDGAVKERLQAELARGFTECAEISPGEWVMRRPDDGKCIRFKIEAVEVEEQ